jgi:uncharacterized protein (DUF1501 family)
MPCPPPSPIGPTAPRPTRREFLRLSGQGLGLLALAHYAPGFVLRSAQARNSAPSASRRILIVVQLIGGNDGLNTIIPFADENYRRLRPTLAIPAAQALPINDTLAFHPACATLLPLFGAGRMSIVQNVGYPNPSLSHFRSNEIWESGVLEPGPTATGWLGRYLDLSPPDLTAAPRAAYLTTDLPLCLHQAGEISLSRQMPAPAGFAPALQTIAAEIAAGTPAEIYVLSLGGFDTHSHQANAHQHLLAILAEGLAGFQRQLTTLGLQENVLIMTTSEFGRSAAENERRGTDHGTAAPIFLLGPQFIQPLQGTAPDLNIARHQQLVASTDFRQVYASVLEDWLGCSAADVLEPGHEKIALFTEPAAGPIRFE